MPTSHRDTRIIAIGLVLILVTGAYFIGRSIIGAKRADENSYNALIPKNEQVDYPTITPESLQKIVRSLENTYILVDIRSKEAFLSSHIQTALSLPDTSLASAGLPSGKKIIVIGSDTDAGLNETVAQWLKDHNYAFAFLQGGYTGWLNLNEQTVTIGDPTSFVDQSKVTYIAPTELKQALQRGEQFFILDAQTPSAYARSHLKDAVNIPLSELESRIQEVPTGEKIIVYGSNATEGFQAATLLFDLNIFSTRVLSGDNVLQGNTDLYLEKSE